MTYLAKTAVKRVAPAALTEYVTVIPNVSTKPVSEKGLGTSLVLVSCPEIRGILSRSKWAGGKAVRAGLAVGGSISEPIRDRSGVRNGVRRTAAGPFSSQPSGPGPVGCFSSAAADRPV